MRADGPNAGWKGLLKNWLSLAGAVIALGSCFSFLSLFAFDALAHFSNPYIGILTYVVAPGFLFFGLFLVMLGIYRARRRGEQKTPLPALTIDFANPRDRRILGWFIFGSVTFLLLSALGSFGTYHFTESVQFCGQACHTVMKPEMVTYHNGSHARVACVECHIGPGAAWFVKAKISGTYQLYAVAFNKYPRPVPTPIKNLRPARETCEQCHWPEKFVGNLVRTYDSYLGDETNTHSSVTLMLKVGGANPGHGPVSGIHWHVYAGNRVEYIATDAARQVIPWVRMTDEHGTVTEYRAPNFTNDISGYTIRQMDCMDCHNRPAHRYRPPNEAVSQAMQLGQISPALPWIKTNAVFALTRTYTNEDEAVKAIDTLLRSRYPGDARIDPAIAAVQTIYRNNFFPEMKANWRSYPENIGHKNWPGCSRCHDDEHKAPNGHKINFAGCTTCHVILSQSAGQPQDVLRPEGEAFVHPADEIPDGYKCSDCHTGGP